MKHQLFLAIDLPDQTHSEVMLVQEQLDKLQLPVIWQPADKLLLHLNFLGKISDEHIGRLNDTISDTLSQFSTFSLKPEFLETMYNRHAVSFVYLGLSGQIEVLKNLQKRLCEAFWDIQIPQEKRYLPHIAIGFVKKADPTFTKSVLDKFNDCSFASISEFTVTKISLYENLSSHNSSHYQRTRQFVLK